MTIMSKPREAGGRPLCALPASDASSAQMTPAQGEGEGSPHWWV